MDEVPYIRPILTNGVELPKTPKATILDWAWYYIYNISRKPLVFMWRRELTSIEANLIADLKQIFLPNLLKQVRTCADCATAFESIQPQFLLSQIKFLISRMKCDDHPELFNSFLRMHDQYFDRAEYLARRINGF
jgi:hypothetical protein